MEPVSDIEVAQRFCDDVVVAAGCFRPNAPGRFELSSLNALSERQLLKSRGAFFAERVLVAVTPIEVVAVAMDMSSLFRARRLVWSRSELSVTRVDSRAEPGRAPAGAMHLSRSGCSPRLEVVPQAGDQASRAVMDRLLGGDPHAHDRV